MLTLKNIVKVYKVGEIEEHALKGISLNFERGELVSIVGPSGCGKTTALNIIGGLDRYTSGDLIINGKSTKEFQDADWDAYRNNNVGFIFQSYNLISHISVLDNVEMAMTLSGKSSEEKRKRALEVLERVGLKDHLHKKTTVLSGGQKQRVAIARALANNPDIILADEPTGALDSKTSKQIMELITEIAKDKLVIMVTHNKEIAEEYSTRIISLLDGEVINDTIPNPNIMSKEQYKIKKTSMNYKIALKLSFNNLKTKWIRAMSTAIAGSIGIIGIALVLSISSGFNKEIETMQKQTLSGLPLYVMPFSMVPEIQLSGNNSNDNNQDDYIYPFDYLTSSNVHINRLTQEYFDYLDQMDKAIYDNIVYNYSLNFNLLIRNNGVVAPLNASDIKFNELLGDYNSLSTQYDLIYGQMATTANEVILIVDANNQVDKSVLQLLGYDVSSKIDFPTILDKEFVVAKNNDYYVPRIENGKTFYSVNPSLDTAYNNGTKLKVTGIMRIKKDAFNPLHESGIYYTNALMLKALENARTSDIAITQKSVDYDVLNMNNDLPTALKNVGADTTPSSIQIFTSDIESKNRVKEYLDAFNIGRDEVDQIKYMDLGEAIGSILGNLVNSISIVLIAFASISLVVSSIMISIITYVSVLERTKEIGVLRSLGARKKDIKRVFNAETFIIGLIAGVFGIAVAYILQFPINIIVHRLQENITKIAQLQLIHALTLVLISIILSVFSGVIPAHIASKKDPVEALRVE